MSSDGAVPGTDLAWPPTGGRRVHQQFRGERSARDSGLVVASIKRAQKKDDLMGWTYLIESCKISQYTLM